jgi:hypothetical protein
MQYNIEELSILIVDCLCKRRGFENWWLDLEDEDVDNIYEELRQTIEEFINEEHYNCN